MSGQKASFTKILLKSMIFIVAIITITLVLASTSESSDASGDRFSIDGIEYEVESGCTASVVNSYNIDVIIPSDVTYNGVKYNVTSMYYDAFYMNKVVKTVTIPDTITSISSAFQECTSLTSINVSQDNKGYCSIDGVLFSKSGDSLLAYPSGKEDKEFTIQSSVKYIPYIYNNYLESLTIECSDDSDFYTNKFMGCSRLKEIIVSDGNTAFCSDTGVLFNKSKTELISYPVGKTDDTYYIPDSVIKICSQAICNNPYLRSVVISHSVESIGSDAFGYSLLKSIDIPENVRSIDYGAFSYCYDLVSVNISNGVTEIGSYAFRGCISLTSVTIPSTVKSIGAGAFSECCKLSSIQVSESSDYYASVNGVLMDKDKRALVCYPEGKIDCNYTIPSSIETIEGSAFSHCKNLEYIVIGSNVTKIGNEYSDAFYDCTSLKSIEVSTYNDNYCSQGGVLFNKSVTKLIHYPAKKTDSQFIVPNTVCTINQLAFYDCIYLKSIELPSGLTVLPYFYNCSSLESIIIPDGVTTIQSGFSGCSSLMSVKIGKSVTTIVDSAFSDCPSLNSITVDKDNSVYCSVDGVLFNKEMTDLICYPSNKEGATYSVPETVKHIHDYAFRSCTRLENVTISKNVSCVDDGAFIGCTKLKQINVVDGNSSYVSVDGVLFTKTMTELISYPGGKTDKSYSIPEGVKIIHQCSFYGQNLEEVLIPSTVESCAYAFTSGSLNYSASSLKEIKVSDDNCFYSSENGALLSKDKKILYEIPLGLDEFTIPDSVEKISVVAVKEKLVLSENIHTVAVFSIIIIGGECEIVIKNKDTLFCGSSILTTQDKTVLKTTAPEGYVLPSNAIFVDYSGGTFDIQYSYVSDSDKSSSNNMLLYAIIAAVIIVILIVIVLLVIKRSKEKRLILSKYNHSSKVYDNMPCIHDGSTSVLDLAQYENEIEEMSERLISTTLFDIADRLTNGIHIREDHVEDLTKKGAFAQTAIGFMYLYGIGGLKQSDEDAFRFLECASADGHYYVQLALACLYATGRGVEHDIEKAIHWFSIAEKRSNGEFKMDKKYL